MEVNQIALLELDGDQDVARRGDGEQKMRVGHRRRRPEGEEPANVERMAHQAVRARRSELQGRVFLAPQVQPHLTQAEEVEMVSISEKTVRNHISNLYDKLGVWSRAQAVIFARDHDFRR